MHIFILLRCLIKTQSNSLTRLVISFSIRCSKYIEDIGDVPFEVIEPALFYMSPRLIMWSFSEWMNDWGVLKWNPSWYIMSSSYMSEVVMQNRHKSRECQKNKLHSFKICVRRLVLLSSWTWTLILIVSNHDKVGKSVAFVWHPIVCCEHLLHGARY